MDDIMDQKYFKIPRHLCLFPEKVFFFGSFTRMEKAWLPVLFRMNGNRGVEEE